MAEETWKPPGRLRRLLSDLAACVLYAYLAALPVFFGLGWLAGQSDGFLVLSLILTAPVYLGLGFMIFMVVAYEEDWWDDFREQNRATVVFLVLHLIGLPAVWLWSRSVGG